MRATPSSFMPEGPQADHASNACRVDPFHGKAEIVRLRPMGGDGPLATEITAFERYYRDDAWTWELMALTRARPVTGPEALVARIEALIAERLRQPRELDRLAADVRDMRNRMATEHGTNDIFAIKHVRGGLVEH